MYKCATVYKGRATFFSRHGHAGNCRVTYKVFFYARTCEAFEEQPLQGQQTQDAIAGTP